MPHPAVLEHPLHHPNLMYDNPSTSSSSSFQVEDFLNLDLLSGNDDAGLSASASSATTPADAVHAHSTANSTSSSSRASSEARTDSPTNSFANLQTPPQADAIPTFDISMGMNYDSSAFGSLATIEEESMFTLGINAGGDYFKPGTDPLAGLSHSPFDLFASLDSSLGSTGATSSDASVSAVTPASTTSANGNASFTFSAIDPQLVRTPMTPATSATDSHSENGAEADEDGEASHGLLITPVKVGGKGKARRGTLQSGGVSKKVALSGPQSIFGSLSSVDGSTASVGRGLGNSGGGPSHSSKFSGKERGSKDKDHDIEDEDLDDWRPSPEEYAKMSSKEKRQLRNKISARNFRIRRKEYISTLEGDIADRDRLIEAIRAELGSTKSENSALRQEVEALKKAILEGRASPMLPPPAPLSPLSPLSSLATLPSSSSSASSIMNASSSSKPNSNGNIIKPNTHKDLPTSPRLGASPFWGGQAGGFGSLGGGITSVHTAIIPETGTSVFGSEDRQKENINPALNIHAQQQQQQQQQQVPSQVLSQLYGNGNNNGAKGGSDWHGTQNAFDALGFADVNPFTLRTLDAYRMQLWSRMAAQVQHAQRECPRPMDSHNAAAVYPSPYSSPSLSENANSSLSGLASSLRPQYFASASSRTPSSPTNATGTGKPLGSLLLNKGLPYGHAHHGLPTPPASPRVGEKDRAALQQNRRPNQQRERELAQTNAMLATLASQTLLQKLGSAFWEAFSPSPGFSSGPAPPARTWDTDKVLRVLEGSAVLRVVDVDRTPTSVTSKSADAIADGMQSMSLDDKQERRLDDSRSEKKGLFARMSSCSSCSSRKDDNV